MPSDSHKRIIAAAVYELLAPQRFKKKALVFSRTFPDVMQFVGLQSSSASTADDLKITVNLGVLVPSLCGDGRPMNIWSSQWRERLGYLMPEPSDRWWLVGTERDASAAAADIVAGLRSYGLPKLATLTSKSSLAELWRSGRSPGITDFQRKRYLDCIANEPIA